MRPPNLHICMLLVAMLASDPAVAVDVSAELGLVSDYRYRGYTLSDGKPALQGALTIEHDSGANAGIWSSTIDEPEFEPDVEVDLTGGYWLELSKGLSLDLSATYYVYPGKSGSNYVEATALVERSTGPATLKAGVSYVPEQGATRDDGGRKRANSYLFVGASYELARFPLTLSAELGRERGFFDGVEHGGKWDWSLSGKLAVDEFRLGLTYSGTDAGQDALVASAFLDF